ncbi:hypothetical protein CFP56_021986 [Quercus suber]|uniref:Transmembrane protein n=1 Tax=Quercus suber TaxID=58331 RepID=A0AAW0KBU9_QUESU
MGLFTYTMAGGGFILMGTWEALTSTNPNHNSIPSSPFSTIHPPQQASSSKTKANPSSSSSLTFVFFSVLSSLFLLNSLVSFFDALNSNDKTGSALQLQVLAIASLFLLYSLTGFVYRPLSTEMQQIENAQFTLDSDDDIGEEIKEVENMGKQNVGMLELGVNGHGSH